MGHIHGHHLTQANIPWAYYDLNMPTPDYEAYSHVIIATPPETHFDVYSALPNKAARTLIEKPIVLKWEQLWVIKEPLVFPGMSERYNPVTAEVSRLLTGRTLRRMHFTRSATQIRVDDIGIHDIDLAMLWKRYCWRWYWETPKHTTTQTLYLDDVPVTFDWYASKTPERHVVIETNDGWISADFLNQKVGMQQLPPVKPIGAEHAAFFSDQWDKTNVAFSHTILFELVEKLNMVGML
jgi:hypothetical protein